jgi:hypothetical protein
MQVVTVLRRCLGLFDPDNGYTVFLHTIGNHLTLIALHGPTSQKISTFDLHFAHTVFLGVFHMIATTNEVYLAP